MAVGLTQLSKLFPVDGIQIGITQAGIKYPDRSDLTVIELCESANTAAVFTKNQFCAAPVVIAKKHLAQKKPRYLVINTGNANAGTGEQGMLDAVQTCKEIARLKKVTPQEVMPFSTGVIGENLPMDRVLRALPDAVASLKSDNWISAAEAIMTTDTMAKGFSKTFQCGGVPVVITGIAKGAGMICPNMATLLSYVATDAKIEQKILQNLLNEANSDSFNSITVDSDTSTNDSCVLVASGEGALIINEDTDKAIVDAFYQHLLEVMQHLAQSLIRDAEGATKFISVTVNGANNNEECRQVAYTVAHSPLVKTAFFASDPNWGRILAAVGRAGLDDLDVSQVSIYLDEVCIVDRGARALSYCETQGQAVMDQEDIHIIINLARGNASHTIWTSDLSYEYIKINAEYRT